MELVWYVAYGSNMLRERFLAYLAGSAAETFGGVHHGARDSTEPRDDRVVELPHKLYFAGQSRRWGGPVAFLEIGRHPTPITLGRAYLISGAQLEDVVAQENGRSSVEPWRHVPEPTKSLEVVVPGKYNCILGLDAMDGLPAVTLTTNRDLPRGRPGASYLKVIGSALSQMRTLDVTLVDRYRGVFDAVAATS